MIDREFIAYIFELCKSEGIENVRVHFENHKTVYLNIENGEVEEFSQADEEGINLSGSYEGYFCSTYIEKITKAMLEAAIGEMKETAKENGKKETNAPLVESKNNLVPFKEVNWSEIAEQLKRSQEEIKKLDDRIISINNTSLKQVWVQTTLFGENAVEMTESYGYFRGAVELVVQEDEKKQDAYRSMTLETPENMDYLQLGKQALQSATGLLEARPLQSGEYDVVFENRVAADLFSYFLPIFEQAEAKKGNSKYAGRQDEEVASPILTIYEESGALEVPKRRSFDDEGTKTERKYFLKNGRVDTFINCFNEAEGKKLTGNAFRSHYRGRIQATAIGTFIEAGDRTTSEILNEMERVVFITGLDGLFAGVNAKTGDFSVIATGFLVEKGSVVCPVNQITVGGNFYHLVKNIVELSSDVASADYWENYVLSPAVFVRQLKIGGL